MRVKALIRREADGEVREYAEAYESTRPDAREGFTFQWTDGNYGCDCNRAIFFNGEGYTPSEERPCGEGAFRVRLLDADTGEVLVDEWEPVLP